MKLQQLEEKFDTKKEGDGIAAHNGEAVLADKAHSIEFITRDDQISTRCNDIAKCVEEIEEYSYQFNVKIVGMPLRAAKET